MSMRDPELFFATYGPWSAHGFFANATPANRVALVVMVQIRKRGSVDPARIGPVIRSVWDAILAALPEAVGHRVGWRELAFFAPTAEPSVVADIVRPITACSDPDIEVRAAVQRTLADSVDRIGFVDELMMGLDRVEYRRAFPNAWCLRDGATWHQPS